MSKYFKYIALLLLTIGNITNVKSQERTRILFVFDASNSMNGSWAKERKIVTASRLLSEAMSKLEYSETLELGLRVYGHQTLYRPGHQDCEDTELVVSIGTGRNLIIQQELKKIIPKGTTPIARSLEKAADDFTECDDCRNIIILITDGIEACDGDPCAVSRALQAKGIILKPFVIGIGMDEMMDANLKCVGNYFDASKEEVFRDVLDIVITQALNSTTSQISILDENNLPTITNVPITIYNEETGEVVNNFVHTLNEQGHPDTISLDPLIKYCLQVHTIPPMEKCGFKLKAGEHNVLEIQAPQGNLNLIKTGLDYRDLKCLVKKKGDCPTVNMQDMGVSEKYLVGTYDLEIFTTPPTIIKDVEIKANEITDLSIPKPGTLYLKSNGQGYGGIFKLEENRMVSVTNFTNGFLESRYTLQPGKYKVVFRSKHSRQTIFTFEKEFTIKSGKSTNVAI